MIKTYLDEAGEIGHKQSENNNNHDGETETVIITERGSTGCLVGPGYMMITVSWSDVHSSPIYLSTTQARMFSVG